MQTQTAVALSIPAVRTRTPKSKADVLEALQLTIPEAQIKRTKNHVAEVFFPDTGATFLLTVHKPRGPKSPLVGAAAAQAKKANGHRDGKEHDGKGRGRRRSARH